MTDFFREVDEDVRRDRVVALWTKYQYWILALAVVIIGATVAWRSHVYFRNSEAQAVGAQYQAALKLSQEGKSTEAEAAFASIAASAPRGYASLSRLRAADELAKRDPDAAIKAYDALAADQAYDIHFRNIAQLRAAYLRVDRGDPTEVARQLSPLAADDFPYHDSIRELLGLNELKRNDFEAAGRWFDPIITDLTTPPNLRQRVEAFLSLVQGGKPPARPAPAADSQVKTAPQAPAPQQDATPPAGSSSDAPAKEPPK